MPSQLVNLANGGGNSYSFNNFYSDGKSFNHINMKQYNDLPEFCLEDDEDNPKIETSTMSESKKKDYNKIKEIVYFIVNSLDRD